ncbi:MAG: indole-3-glycerol phosphate synthase TrpC [Defluviitaleaceae bacterium]|nr:indole-3-glycerol phosphate synthase TrpC [Defluviitaleaceae bacterium]
MSILQEIASKTKARVAKSKTTLPLAQLIKLAEQTKQPPSFKAALKQPNLSFICEVKKASPSKGVIAPDFKPLDIAKTYEQVGARAISVLTEPFYFQGADAYLKEIAEHVKIPLLRKDFIVDEYMIYEAKVLGASAILLIVSLLDQTALTRYLNVAHDIGLDVLVEVHSEAEAELALQVPTRIIGVNHRNLSDFTMDMTLSEKIKKQVPAGCVFVAESGLHTGADIHAMRVIGADAVLIGESFMRHPDKAAKMAELKGESS